MINKIIGYLLMTPAVALFGSIALCHSIGNTTNEYFFAGMILVGSIWLAIVGIVLLFKGDE